MKSPATDSVTWTMSIFCVTESCIFASQLITVNDLLQFKKQLLVELIAELKSQINIVPKKWLKSHEVRRLLKISPGTLQTLKSSGILPYSKMGGIHFFDCEEIQQNSRKGKNEWPD